MPSAVSCPSCGASYVAAIDLDLAVNGHRCLRCLEPVQVRQTGDRRSGRFERTGTERRQAERRVA